MLESVSDRTETLSCQRAAFSLPEGAHYLNCAYMSPLPCAVEAAGVPFVTDDGRPEMRGEPPSVGEHTTA